MGSPAPTPNVPGREESLLSVPLSFLPNSYPGSPASEPSDPAHWGLQMELPEEEWRIWDPHLGVVAERSYLA